MHTFDPSKPESFLTANGLYARSRSGGEWGLIQKVANESDLRLWTFSRTDLEFQLSPYDLRYPKPPKYIEADRIKLENRLMRQLHEAQAYQAQVNNNNNKG